MIASNPMRHYRNRAVQMLRIKLSNARFILKSTVTSAIVQVACNSSRATHNVDAEQSPMHAPRSAKWWGRWSPRPCRPAAVVADEEARVPHHAVSGAGGSRY